MIMKNSGCLGKNFYKRIKKALSGPMAFAIHLR